MAWHGAAARTLALRLGGYALVCAVLVAVWFAVTASNAVPALLVPEPREVADSLWNQVITDGSALWITVLRAVLGTVLGLLLGSALAVFAYSVPSLEPLARLFGMVMRCIPVLALAPLIATLFGYGGPGAVATATAMSFFPAFALVGGALGRIPGTLSDLVKVVGGGHGVMLRHIALPVALPELALAAKLTSCVSVLAVLTAEFLTANDGLGALLARAQGLVDTPALWACLLTSLISSFLAYEVMDHLERRVRDRLSLHRN